MKLSVMFDPAWGLHWYFSKAREYPGIHKIIAELKREAKVTPKNWTKFRDQRLRRLLIFAQDNVPYYKKVFDQVGFDPVSASLPDEIEFVPPLIKDLVREQLNSLLADTTDRSNIFENATGGSTGVPLKFYQDIHYQTVEVAIDAYVREWWGIRPYDRTALAWGADREFSELSLKERLYEIRQRTKSLNAFRMTDENLYEFCLMLTRWHPPYLMGYSSALETLAKCARDNGIKNLAFKAIRSTAEVLFPRQRQLIEETLNGPVYNFYGSREVSNIAAECPEDNRLHLISTWRYVEIVDERGRRMPDGEFGNIAVTDLSNFAMPFIRYLNGDMARMAKEPCPCGRSSPVIEELLGRSADLIRTHRGDIIHGEFFTHLFYGRDDIKQFQIHQTSLDHLVLRYVPINHVPSEFIEKVLGKIREQVGEEVTVDIEACKEIPTPPSGKYRFTISDVDPPN